eukprot:Pgem_evm1s8680
MIKSPKLIPRPYQLECFKKVVNENLIINLPTGSGKTLIATLAIDYYLKLQPKQKIMFI